jgi:acetyl esterase/lipase
MKPELRRQLAALGRGITPDVADGTRALLTPLMDGIDPATLITRDLSYGPDARNRLDVFTQAGRKGAPVLLFLHGGAFIGGDKHTEGSPFYSNIGDAAARNGLVGVTMTYRLAPDHKYPSGPEDVGRAIGWIKANIAQYGGDPERIVVLGTSAGGVHVAGYVAFKQHHVGPGGGIRGAIMLSATYDTRTCAQNDNRRAYYGQDTADWGAAATMPGLLSSDVPQLFTISELDPEDFHTQAAHLVGAWGLARAQYPEMHLLAGHNHMSPAMSIGSSEKEIERMVMGFARRVTR